MAQKILSLLIVSVIFLGCGREKSIEEVERLLIGQWAMGDPTNVLEAALVHLGLEHQDYLIFSSDYRAVYFHTKYVAMKPEEEPKKLLWQLVSWRGAIFIEFTWQDSRGEEKKSLYEIKKITSKRLRLSQASGEAILPTDHDYYKLR